MLAAQKYVAEVTGYGLVGSQNDAMRSLMSQRDSRGKFTLMERDHLPSLAETLVLMEKHGLDVREVENRSYHYHRTVEQWLANFETHWERIRAFDPVRFGEKFRRTWLFYLGGAADTFEAVRESINCYHVTFVKGHFARSGRSPPGDHLLSLLTS